jgi:hypothetical protein
MATERLSYSRIYGAILQTLGARWHEGRGRASGRANRGMEIWPDEFSQLLGRF